MRKTRNTDNYSFNIKDDWNARCIEVRFKLSRKDEELLKAYCAHLSMSIPSLIRNLVKKELKEETLLYDKN